MIKYWLARQMVKRAKKRQFSVDYLEQKHVDPNEPFPNDSSYFYGGDKAGNAFITRMAFRHTTRPHEYWLDFYLKGLGFFGIKDDPGPDGEGFQMGSLKYEPVETGQLITTGDQTLLTRANRRRELLPETDNFQFDEVCNGIPQPREDKYIPDLKQDQLYGTPVSSGKVKARARVINTIEDADLLEKGEIMVASFTDIGWTPYFSIISGLVTEIGSPLSHGAVVAREYGIPAIVGAKGAKDFVCDGDFVLLDGDKGIIERMRNVKS